MRFQLCLKPSGFLVWNEAKQFCIRPEEGWIVPTSSYWGPWIYMMQQRRRKLKVRVKILNIYQYDFCPHETAFNCNAFRVRFASVWTNSVQFFNNQTLYSDKSCKWTRYFSRVRSKGTEGITDLVGEPFSGVEEHEDHHLVGGHGDDVFPGAAFRYCASTSTNLVTDNTTKCYQATSSSTCWLSPWQQWCCIQIRPRQGQGTNGFYATVWSLSHYTWTTTGADNYSPLPNCLGPGPCLGVGFCSVWKHHKTKSFHSVNHEVLT